MSVKSKMPTYCLICLKSMEAVKHGENMRRTCCERCAKIYNRVYTIVSNSMNSRWKTRKEKVRKVIKILQETIK